MADKNLRALVSGLTSFFVTKKGNNTIEGNLLPATNGTYNLGSSTLRFNSIYANNLIGVPAAPDELVKTNASDPASGYLDDKVSVGVGILKNIVANKVQFSANLTDVVSTSTNIIAGNGLQGGGTLTTNVTLSVRLQTTSGMVVDGTGLRVGAGTLISVGASSVSLSNGAAQYQVPVTGSTPFTPAWTNLSTFAGNGLSFSGGQFVIGAGTLISVGATSVALSNGSAQYQVPVTGSTPFTPSWTGLSTFAGNGMSFTGGQFVIEAGTLITVGANNVGISTGANYQFIGTGAGTAATWRDVSELAGDGLNVTNGVLRVDSTTLTVSANAVDLPTPGTLTTGTNNSAASGHTHAIDASHDVSTVQNKILRDNNGLLIVGTLSTPGNITITGTGGDLTVGNNVLFVDNSGLNVGINRIPDPQFALDVSGPLRADYLVGKLAMQLNGITSLWQFDGPEPSPTNAGETRNHLGQSPTTETGVTFTYGKFGKAIQTPVATTNLVTNPSFETNLTGWTDYAAGGATGTRARVTTSGYAGSCSYQLVKTGGGAGSGIRWGASHNITGLAATTTYAFSAWVNITAMGGGTTQTLRMVTGGTAFANVEQTLATVNGVTDGWVRLTGTRTTDADGGTAILWFWMDNCDTGTVYLDAVQVEAQPYATAYCDGTLGNGHSWTGTAHASTSQRSNAQLRYDGTKFLNSKTGTIMAWVRPDAVQNQMIFSSTGSFWLRARGDARWDFGFNTTSAISGSNYTAGTWYHVALTWDSTSAILYVNGVNIRTLSTGGLNLGSINNTFDIGWYRPSSNQWWTGAIDNFAILNRAMPEKEILSVYLTDAPVFAVSSTFNFRATPRGLVWADDEGLWVKDVNGAAVLGVYAGENSTKSWGNFTMQQGDIAFGSYGVAGGGWLYFDDDGGSGTGILQIGYADKTIWDFTSTEARLTGVLSIGTNGGIYQGTGLFATPTTGLKLWRDGSLGRMAGYFDGVEQWTVDTNGRISAGGGNVRLSASGIYAVQGTIGGWILSGQSLVASADSTRVELYVGNPGDTAFSTGSADRNNAPVMIKNDGKFYLGGMFNPKLSWNGTTLAIDGNITSGSGMIGGWTLTSNTLSATNLIFTSGAANVAHIIAGTGTTAGGINAATAGGTVFWAGSNYAGRDSAAFRVTTSGALIATSATISGVITATSGSIDGLLAIGSTGQIRQGTGTWGVNFSGIRMWNDAGVGKLTTYSLNTAITEISNEGIVMNTSGALDDASIKFKESGTTFARVGVYRSLIGDFDRFMEIQSLANGFPNLITLKAQNTTSTHTQRVQLVTSNTAKNATLQITSTNAASGGYFAGEIFWFAEQDSYFQNNSNSKIFYDLTTTAQTSNLRSISFNNNKANFQAETYVSGSTSPALFLGRFARGNYSPTPTAVANNDMLAAFVGQGYATTAGFGNVNAWTGGMVIGAGQAFSSGSNRGTYLHFYTTRTGESTPFVAMGIGTQGDVTIPQNRLSVTQNSTSAAVPVLELDQKDIDDVFINFIGTASGAADDRSIRVSTGGSIGTYAGRIRIKVNGTQYWLPFYTV